MNRRDRIAADLAAAEAEGTVTSWYAYAPGGGIRWVVDIRRVGTRVFTTREAEAFIIGHYARGLT